MFLIKKDKDFSVKKFSRTDIKRVYDEFKKISIDQNEECLDYIKDEEESVIEKFL